MPDKPAYFEPCPECGAEIRRAGMLLCQRDEDDCRVCKATVLCENDHTSWRWADRSSMPLQRDDSLSFVFHPSTGEDA
jgi:hypothetical protein